MKMDIEHMSRDTKMWRIGHILSKGISLMLAKEMEEREALARNALTIQSDETNGEGQTTELCDDSNVIMDYLRRMGPSSPASIWHYTGISRMTVFRRLKRMHSAGLLRKSGSTSAVRYAIDDATGKETRPSVDKESMVMISVATQ